MNRLFSIGRLSPLLRSRRFANQGKSVRLAQQYLSTSSNEPREAIYYDVVTVGAGPAGLSAAIRLKQLAIEKGVDISVCVVEKGAEVGAHVLSGNVFEPTALNELFPNWKELGAPLETKAREDNFKILTETSSYSIPNILVPPQLHNEGNYIISLSQLTRWMAQQAEQLGVEIYSGFAADGLLYNGDGSIRGIATKDAGIAKDGSRKDTYTPGIEIVARQTLLAEGCRGSCSEELINKFNLRQGKDVQSYGLGIKEVWQIPKEKFRSGFIQHTLGYPLQSQPMSDVFGGTFMYHQDPDLVLIGMVVGLDYPDPYLNPYKEFQRWKHHPEVAKHLEGGECISYGARVLNEGGYHAIPKLTVPGAALLGCSAGFLNSIKIKGTHTAMKSGMLAAEALYPRLVDEGAEKTVAVAGDQLFVDEQQLPKTIEIADYESSVYSSWIGKELHQVRNIHSAFHYGFVPGVIHAGITSFVTKGYEPWTLKNSVTDSQHTKPASQYTPRDYPKPDGKLSFELLTNLQRSGTSHDHDQPPHLRVKEDKKNIPSDVSIKEFAGPEQRFCPAGVYEYTEPDKDGKRSLVINAQNCVHCKCCSIKTPQEFIQWTVPEGGGGPAYTVM